MTDIPTYHVLALSGGGYRGLYTATVLAELEAVLGRPIASHFDLICGTSAGGMLALGLAAEIPGSELKALFEDEGSRIFGCRSLSRRLLGFWLTAKHDSAGLREVLTERFQGTTVGDLKHRVLVPAVNYSTGRGQFFKPAGERAGGGAAAGRDPGRWLHQVRDGRRRPRPRRPLPVDAG